MPRLPRSRRWLPGGGSHHPFLYRKAGVIDLTAVDKLIGSLREVIDLTAEERTLDLPVPRRRVDPFDAVRRAPQRTK